MQTNDKDRAESSEVSERDQETSGPPGAGRKRFSGKKQRLLLVAGLAILTAALLITHSQYRASDFRSILARAKLAKLPGSARHLQVDIRPAKTRGQPLPDQYWLVVRFQAEPNDISRFIANSPGVDTNRCYPLVASPDGDYKTTQWPPDQPTSGRAYRTVGKKGILSGAVFIYDDSGTVRIRVRYRANPELHETLRLWEAAKDGLDDFVDDVIHEVSDSFGD